MQRVVCGCALLLLFFSAPPGSVAQEFGGISGFPGAFFRSARGLGSFNLAAVKLRPSVRVGYQWIGLNFNLPTPEALGFADSAPIDIQLRDANVWVGSVGLEALLTSRLSLFVNGEANAKKNAGAVTSEDPLRDLTGLAPYRWDASGLEWWALEGGAAFEIFDGTTLFAGLRRDHLSFRMNNPRDALGNPINFVLSVPNIVLLTETNAADFQAKLWIPYLGLRMTGPNYRGSLIWSPFVSAAVRIPDVSGSRCNRPD